MRFEQLLQQVEKAERRVEARMMRSENSWRALKRLWRESWTPARIVAVGLAGGFLFGRARPLRAAGAVSTTRWIQLATSVSGLLASLKASQAAESAEVAATEAEDAAVGASETVEAVAATAAVAPASTLPPQAPSHAADGLPRGVADGPRRQEAPFASEPRPAEAATELSER